MNEKKETWVANDNCTSSMNLRFSSCSELIKFSRTLLKVVLSSAQKVHSLAALMEADR
jgi:hypothetical protein